MRDYGKVYSTFWSSTTVQGMSDDGKLLALYLMTCSHSTIAGVFRLPDGYASEDLGWSIERVREGFEELLAKGFANRCETTKWVWVVKHLDWNPPENPNQRKAAAKVALSVPDETGWKPVFMRVCGDSLGLSTPEKSNPSGTVSEPLLNQKQEQKQKQEQEQKQQYGGATSTERAPDSLVFADWESWRSWFDEEIGIACDPHSASDRKQFRPLAQEWITAGLSVGAMRAAIAKARTEAKSPIAYLPAYVAALIRANSAPPPANTDRRSRQLATAGLMTGQVRPIQKPIETVEVLDAEPVRVIAS